MNAEEFRTMLDIHAEPEDGKYPTLDDYSAALHPIRNPVTVRRIDMQFDEPSWWGRQSYDEKLSIFFGAFFFIATVALWAVIHFNLDGHG